MRRRSRRPSISAWRCRLISSEGNKLSDVGIKVNSHAIDQIRDSLFIHELVFVRVVGAAQATGYFAVSSWFWRLAESENWRNYQDRQHK